MSDLFFEFVEILHDRTLKADRKIVKLLDLVGNDELSLDEARVIFRTYRNKYYKMFVAMGGKNE